MMNTIAEIPLASSNQGEVAHYHGGYTTAHIVTRLFPHPTLGQVFFERFVERAKSNQDVLPDEPESSAIIRCDSIALLGKELGLSNDTTHKYVTLYIALGLLTKRKILGRLYFVLSLGIYHAPETLAANLEYHITHSTTRKSRSKFHQLFVDVKERCLVYGLIASDLPQTMSRLNALLHPEKGESRIRLDRRIQQAQHLFSTLTTAFFAVLSPHNTTQVDSLYMSSTFPAPSTSITRRVDSLLQDRAQKSTHVSISDRTETASLPSAQQKNLPDFAALVDPSLHQMPKNLPTSAAVVDARSHDTRKNLPITSAKVDEKHVKQIAASTLLAQSGRPEASSHRENLPTMHSQVDTHTTFHTFTSTSNNSVGRREEHVSANLPVLNAKVEAERDEKSTQNGDESRRITESTPQNLPEASAKVDSLDAIRNVDVDSIYDYITSTLRDPVALSKFFAVQFEGDERVYPKYRKLLRSDDGQPRSPHILLAAYICTQVRNYRDDWKLKQPGGYFTLRCREYSTGSGVPEEVEEWIRCYQDIPVPQFIAKLRQEADQGKLKPQQSVGKPMPEPIIPTLKLLPTTSIERRQAAMTAEEADQLVDTIVDKGRSTTFRAARVRIGKENPRYVVLVDAALRGSPELQVIIYSVQDWQHRMETGKSISSLFSSEQLQSKE